MFRAAQGEVNVRQIKKLPAGLINYQPNNGNYIIGHSESGHHHVIGGAGVTVKERIKDVPDGMKILYAIIKNPTALTQDAPAPHGEIALDPGIYEFRISREYNPFAEEARMVAD